MPRKKKTNDPPPNPPTVFPGGQQANVQMGNMPHNANHGLPFYLLDLNEPGPSLTQDIDADLNDAAELIRASESDAQMKKRGASDANGSMNLHHQQMHAQRLPHPATLMQPHPGNMHSGPQLHHGMTPQQMMAYEQRMQAMRQAHTFQLQQNNCTPQQRQRMMYERHMLESQMMAMHQQRPSGSGMPDGRPVPMQHPFGMEQPNMAPNVQPRTLPPMELPPRQNQSTSEYNRTYDQMGMNNPNQYMQYQGYNPMNAPMSYFPDQPAMNWNANQVAPPSYPSGSRLPPMYHMQSHSNDRQALIDPRHMVQPAEAVPRQAPPIPPQAHVVAPKPDTAVSEASGSDGRTTKPIADCGPASNKPSTSMQNVQQIDQHSEIMRELNGSAPEVDQFGCWNDITPASQPPPCQPSTSVPNDESEEVVMDPSTMEIDLDMFNPMRPGSSADFYDASNMLIPIEQPANTPQSAPLGTPRPQFPSLPQHCETSQQQHSASQYSNYATQSVACGDTPAPSGVVYNSHGVQQFATSRQLHAGPQFTNYDVQQVTTGTPGTPFVVRKSPEAQKSAKSQQLLAVGQYPNYSMHHVPCGTSAPSSVAHSSPEARQMATSQQHNAAGQCPSYPMHLVPCGTSAPSSVVHNSPEARQMATSQQHSAAGQCPSYPMHHVPCGTSAPSSVVHNSPEAQQIAVSQQQNAVGKYPSYNVLHPCGTSAPGSVAHSSPEAQQIATPQQQHAVGQYRSYPLNHIPSGTSAPSSVVHNSSEAQQIATSQHHYAMGQYPAFPMQNAPPGIPSQGGVAHSSPEARQLAASQQQHVAALCPANTVLNVPSDSSVVHNSPGQTTRNMTYQNQQTQQVTPQKAQLDARANSELLGTSPGLPAQSEISVQPAETEHHPAEEDQQPTEADPERVQHIDEAEKTRKDRCFLELEDGEIVSFSDFVGMYLHTGELKGNEFRDEDVTGEQSGSLSDKNKEKDKSGEESESVPNLVDQLIESGALGYYQGVDTPQYPVFRNLLLHQGHSNTLSGVATEQEPQTSNANAGPEQKDKLKLKIRMLPGGSGADIPEESHPSPSKASISADKDGAPPVSPQVPSTSSQKSPRVHPVVQKAPRVQPVSSNPEPELDSTLDQRKRKSDDSTTIEEPEKKSRATLPDPVRAKVAGESSDEEIILNRKHKTAQQRREEEKEAEREERQRERQERREREKEERERLERKAKKLARIKKKEKDDLRKAIPKTKKDKYGYTERYEAARDIKSLEERRNEQRKANDELLRDILARAKEPSRSAKATEEKKTPPVSKPSVQGSGSKLFGNAAATPNKTAMEKKNSLDKHSKINSASSSKRVPIIDSVQRKHMLERNPTYPSKSPIQGSSSKRSSLDAAQQKYKPEKRPANPSKSPINSSSAKRSHMDASQQKYKSETKPTYRSKSPIRGSNAKRPSIDAAQQKLMLQRNTPSSKSTSQANKDKRFSSIDTAQQKRRSEAQSSHAVTPRSSSTSSKHTVKKTPEKAKPEMLPLFTPSVCIRQDKAGILKKADPLKTNSSKVVPTKTVQAKETFSKTFELRRRTAREKTSITIPIKPFKKLKPRTFAASSSVICNPSSVCLQREPESLTATSVRPITNNLLKAGQCAFTAMVATLTKEQEEPHPEVVKTIPIDRRLVVDKETFHSTSSVKVKLSSCLERPPQEEECEKTLPTPNTICMKMSTKAAMRVKTAVAVAFEQEEKLEATEKVFEIARVHAEEPFHTKASTRIETSLEVQLQRESSSESAAKVFHIPRVDALEPLRTKAATIAKTAVRVAFNQESKSEATDMVVNVPRVHVEEPLRTKASTIARTSVKVAFKKEPRSEVTDTVVNVKRLHVEEPFHTRASMLARATMKSILKKTPISGAADSTFKIARVESLPPLNTKASTQATATVKLDLTRETSTAETDIIMKLARNDSLKLDTKASMRAKATVQVDLTRETRTEDAGTIMPITPEDSLTLYAKPSSLARTSKVVRLKGVTKTDEADIVMKEPRTYVSSFATTSNSMGLVSASKNSADVCHVVALKRNKVYGVAVRDVTQEFASTSVVNESTSFVVDEKPKQTKQFRCCQSVTRRARVPASFTGRGENSATNHLIRKNAIIRDQFTTPESQEAEVEKDVHLKKKIHWRKSRASTDAKLPRPAEGKKDALSTTDCSTVLQRPESVADVEHLQLVSDAASAKGTFKDLRGMVEDKRKKVEEMFQLLFPSECLASLDNAGKVEFIRTVVKLILENAAFFQSQHSPLAKMKAQGLYQWDKMFAYAWRVATSVKTKADVLTKMEELISHMDELEEQEGRLKARMEGSTYVPVQMQTPDGDSSDDALSFEETFNPEEFIM